MFRQCATARLGFMAIMLFCVPGGIAQRVDAQTSFPIQTRQDLFVRDRIHGLQKLGPSPVAPPYFPSFLPPGLRHALAQVDPEFQDVEQDMAIRAQGPFQSVNLGASGVFLEPTIYSSGGRFANGITVADVNGDGRPDVLVANGCRASGTCRRGVVGVLLGKSDGTFRAARNFGSGGDGANAVAVADVNGDGKPDLLVAHSRKSAQNLAGSVGVLLGNGDGTFEPAQTYNSGGTYAVSIAAADVNGDGKVDVLVANVCLVPDNCFNNAGGGVGVLLGNGDGTFQPAQGYSSGGVWTVSVAVGDVNRDGRPDLVVASDGVVAVLLGNGDGTFQSALSYSSGGIGAVSLAVSDVDGDGKLDLLATSSCDSNCADGHSLLAVLLGNGDGTFRASNYETLDSSSTIAVADVNGDGRLDLVLAGRDVSVLLGEGNGTFHSFVTYNPGNVATSIALADINGDGKLDLIAMSACISFNACGRGGVDVSLGNGDGTFRAPRVYNSGGIKGTLEDIGASSVAVGDVNGDGKLDLVVATNCFGVDQCGGQVNGSASVMLGNDDGTFQQATTYDSGGSEARWIALADVNADGRPDILVVNAYTGNAGSIGVLLANGDGTFQPVTIYDSGGAHANWIAVADVNRDGKPDLLVANSCVVIYQCEQFSQQGYGTVGVLLGHGDGTFQPAQALNSGGEFPESVAVADVNHDGNLDLLIANRCVTRSYCLTGEGVIAILLGNGDGTFQPAQTYDSSGFHPLSITVADLNGDGQLDLLVANFCTSPAIDCKVGALATLLGNGDGTFQAAITVQTPRLVFHPGGLAVADFDRDGKLDVAIGGGAVLLLGNGDGSFRAPKDLGAISTGIAVGDFNRDGAPDLAVGGVTILLNALPSRRK